MNVTRRQILDYARTLLGVRYQHQGRTRHGVDCVGVLVMIARHFGITQHDLTGYSRFPADGTLPRELAACLVKIERRAVQPGDVLTFWVRTPGKVQHAALATDRGILHAYHSVTPVGVVETGLDDFWFRRVDQCYRFPGVEETPYPTPFVWPMLQDDPRVLAEVQRRAAAMGKNCCD